MPSKQTQTVAQWGWENEGWGGGGDGGSDSKLLAMLVSGV